MAPKLTLACWDYDRAKPLLDGSLGLVGFDLVCQMEMPCTLLPLAVNEVSFDITELSFASYLVQFARSKSKYIGLPIFLSRAFRHGAIYVYADSGKETPKDLQGRVVGVPEYGMTLAVWVRGIRVDEFSVDVDTLKYRTSGLMSPAETSD